MSIKTLLKFLFIPLLLAGQQAWSQTTVIGNVTDSTDHSPLVGITVAAGNSAATATDARGNYRLLVPSAEQNLTFSSIGYATKVVPISGGPVNVMLRATNSAINEVVVVGYGTERRKDVTGSITTVTSKDFNTGDLTSLDQLITGKVAGVVVTSNGGAPGNGSTIRIRGGSSLNASNDPLIVIDGVPVDNNGISGTPNALDLINPADIESETILKDASAAAIYGNRASNGVIIVTTKKGLPGGQFHVNFSSVNSESIKVNEVPVLSASQFRQTVKKYGTASQIALLGTDSTTNTNWQNQIYQPAFGTDDNLSFSGGIRDLPYRISLEYDNQAGILKTNTFDRSSLAFNLSPTLLNNHLHVDLNFKGAINNNRFANQGAIGSAIGMDPTKPVYATNKLGGYFEWTDTSGAPIQLADRNPLALLELENNTSTAKRSIGNIELNYTMPFLPDLRADLNAGYDESRSSGSIYIPPYAALDHAQGGYSSSYAQYRRDEVFDFYLNYVKYIKNINSRIDLTAGYSYEDYYHAVPPQENKNVGGTLLSTSLADSAESTLLSYYARLNYSFKDKYILTATIRDDGSSRFSPANRYALFPSLAFAWRINEESFLRNSTVLSDLKLRLGYGLTGNQDIGSYYPYLPLYTQSSNVAQYPFGNSSYYTYRAEPYDPNIKWEQTTTFNAGLDYGFLNGRINGSVDVYNKVTSNLIVDIPTPQGANLSNHVVTNVGNLTNTGVEFQLNTIPVRNRNVTWNLDFNITYNQNKITKLTKVATDSSAGIQTGNISGGTGNSIQILSVGYPADAFYVYKQVYDKTGKPIEGVYADVNNNPSNLFYRYKSPNPPVTLGFSTSVQIKNWDFGFTMHGSIGNYMYNNVRAGGTLNGITSNSTFIDNINNDYLKSGFVNSQYYSDYYVENASFLRMDNISLGYNFGRVIAHKVDLRLTAIVQNVFVITKYSGLDPEVSGGASGTIDGGIDNNMYPRPRIYSLGLNASF
jgi:TonB-linked SusC/RagA family outer membrane protein